MMMKDLNILNLLAEKYSKRQIIILSCSNREKDMLNKMNVSFNLIKM